MRYDVITRYELELSLETVITISEAVHEHGISRAKLRRALSSGAIIHRVTEQKVTLISRYSLVRYLAKDYENNG